MQDKRKILRITDEEDAAITAAALSDPDAQPLTEEELAQFVPWAERYSKYFPLQIWCDRDVVDAFQAGGPGWQRRMNDALRDWAQQHGMVQTSS